MHIEGVAAIVTGGASGLGAATAEAMLGGGATVCILDRDAERGVAAAVRLGAHFVAADVTDAASVAAALLACENHHGVARVLVNCAGIGLAKRTLNRAGEPHPLEAFRAVIAVNLLGTFNVVSQFAARLSGAPLLGEESGVIVNTASIAAFDGQIGQAAYAASKGGVAAMTLPVARDLASLRIRVCTIAPGIFWTPMLAALSEQARDSLSKQVPFPQRLGQPAEFAQLACAIIANPMLNGETIRLDGALRMAPR
jgi:NAD(P)-dependent dehydrogenase (short-subunit alcohol dehydrogenase family)